MIDEEIPETEAGDTPEADESAIALEAPVAALDGESEDTEVEESEEAKAAKRKGYQERANTRRLRERAEELQAENDRLKAEWTQPEVKPPDRDSFDDYELYLEARAAHVAEQKFTALQAAAEAKQADNYRRQAQQTSEARWAEASDAAREKYADFDEVATTRDNIRPAMKDAIFASDNGAEIAYYLGKHPTEADKIAAKSPIEQIKAIGAIEERLKERPTRKPLPTPVSRGRTGQSTGQPVLSDNLPMNQWMAIRNKQVGRS